MKKTSDKRENVQKDNRNLFKSINERVASKIEVADWQLEVMVLGAEPVWIAFDMRELQRLQPMAFCFYDWRHCANSLLALTGFDSRHGDML